MYLSKILKTVASVFLLTGIFFTFQSCKKNNDVKPQSQYYFTANINGTPWKATLEEAVDTSNKIIGYGFNIQGQDTSTVAVVFEDNIPLNTPQSISNASDLNNGSTITSVVIYFGNIHDTATVYVTLATTNNAGTLNVTQLDKTNMLVSGTFNATTTSADGKTAVFTNGRFKMPITTSTTQLEKDLHL